MRSFRKCVLTYKDEVHAGSTERKYIVDIVGELPVILMRIELASGNIMKTYISGNGEVLAQHTGLHTAAKYLHLHDRLGSVRQIINTSGLVQKYYTYEPFGQVIESSDGPPVTGDGFLFTGQFYDEEIGEYHLRARQYNPTIARFTGRDPAFGILGGSNDSGLLVLYKSGGNVR